jgi:hypothetical protein
VKHIAHLVTTANLITYQNKFANGISPKDTEPIENGVFEKMALDSEELEIVIENTREGLEGTQAIIKSN